MTRLEQLVLSCREVWPQMSIVSVAAFDSLLTALEEPSKGVGQCLRKLQKLQLNNLWFDPDLLLELVHHMPSALRSFKARCMRIQKGRLGSLSDLESRIRSVHGREPFEVVIRDV